MILPFKRNVPCVPSFSVLSKIEFVIDMPVVPLVWKLILQ